MAERNEDILHFRDGRLGIGTDIFVDGSLSDVPHPSITWKGDQDHPLLLRTINGDNQVALMASGNVGIGTIAPADTLDVNGDVRIRGSDIKDAGGTARITLTDNGNLDLKDAGGTARITLTDNGRLDLKGDNGGTRVSIAANGYVGIGTTTPADTLDVNGDLRVRGSDIKDAGGTARITLIDNGRLDLKEDGGATRVSIAANGNVGIATTAPADTLDVNGDLRVRGSDIKDAGGTARITLTDNGRLDLKEDGGGTRVSIAANGNVGIATTAPADTLDVNGDLRVRGSDIKDAGGTARITLTDNGRLDLKEDGGATRISIAANGNVGIGTTGPADTLDVNGDLRVRGSDIKDAGGTARITLTDNGRLDLKEDGGATRISIAANGNVGIGTTGPADTLDVNGDLRVRGSDIKDAGGTARITLTDNGRLDLKEDGGATRVSIAANGNVGIATTAPADTLDVNGDLRVRGSDIKDAGGTARITLTDNGRLDLKEDGGATRISIAANGYVGIGTTAPADTLDVNGDLRVRGADIKDAGGTSRICLVDNNRMYLRDENGSNRVTIKSKCVTFTPGNLHKTHPAMSGAEFTIGWNPSGGRGETAFYQDGGGGWRSGYDFYTERNGVGKRLQARIEDTGNLNIRGRLGSLSDAREKTNVRPLSQALAKIKALRGVSYNWRDDAARDGGNHLGLIAQEVLEVVPEVVLGGGVNPGGEEEPYQLDYDGLVPLLIEAVKEQQAIITSLEERLSALEAKAREN